MEALASAAQSGQSTQQEQRKQKQKQRKHQRSESRNSDASGGGGADANDDSGIAADGGGGVAGGALVGNVPGVVLDPMRAYRACLHCRSRKTKCNLDVNGGRPPCRRCQRENRECILGESHRGGRRERKKPKVEDTNSTQSPNAASLTPQSVPFKTSHVALYPDPPRSESYQSTYNNGYGTSIQWQDPAPTSVPINNQGYDRRESLLLPTLRKQEEITTAELHNPSDALGILARVADSQENGTSNGGSPRTGLARDRIKSWVEPLEGESVRPVDFSYPPVAEGRIPPQTVFHLFNFYEQFYHPYFPVVPRESFNRARIPWMSKAQPHLFSAIMTVASKDDLLMHQICYTHMQGLISDIVSGADADIEAVEALLLLSQWMCQRPQPGNQVGRGEEDRVAWMYIGTALRLGWYLGIDRASFNDAAEKPAKFAHKRLVWTACYMADRNVSVRLGKGFWARGPGPLPDKALDDFPTLDPTSSDQDHLGMIFKAHLDLTQLFSNVHDILYSTKGNGWKEMLEGRYAKYLDDFRMSIRNWHTKWGKLDCSENLRASVFISYDYLRLYVNAFAYQATISRAMANKPKSKSEPVPLLDASTPDARFIYEAIEAAKSLIYKVNNSVTPEMLRYMPCRYYMYLAYSTVFLYKARSTTAMSPEERTEIRQMINTTIDRLRQSSIGANQMGTRYAKLLELLWKRTPPKAPKDTPRPQPTTTSHAQYTQPQTQTHSQPTNLDHRLLTEPTITSPQNHSHLHSPSNQPNPLLGSAHMYDTTPLPYPNNPHPDPNNPFPYASPHQAHIQDIELNAQMLGNNTFSWLDLPGAYGFATQNITDADLGEVSSATGSLSAGGTGGTSGGWGGGMNLGVVGDFRGLEEGADGLIF